MYLVKTVIATVLLTVGCSSTAPSLSAPPIPAPSADVSTTSPSAASAQPAPSLTPGTGATRAAQNSTGWLLGIAKDQLFAIRQDRSAHRLALGEASAASLSPNRRHIVTVGPRGVTVHRIVTSGAGLQLRQVAVLAGATAAALDDRFAVAAAPARVARSEDDCGSPTVLAKVDLVTGRISSAGTVSGRLLPTALSGNELVSTAPTSDCSSSRVVRTVLSTGRTAPVFSQGETLLLSYDRRTGNAWLRLPHDGEHPHGSQAIVDRTGRVVARVGDFGTAAYGPDGSMAYTQVQFGPKGTERFYFPVATTLRLGHSLPRKGDAQQSLDDASHMVFNPDGSLVVVIAEGEAFRAHVCGRGRLTGCRPLGLTWSGDADGVDLVGVV